MYMYLFSNDDGNLITISREDIVLKAKTEMGNCEAIFTIDKAQANTIMAFLFKTRNFYEPCKGPYTIQRSRPSNSY